MATKRKGRVQALGFIDSLLGDLTKKDKRQLGRFLGFIAGEVATEKYNSLSRAEKDAWDQDRIMHHGDFGAFVEDYGRTKKNALLEGLGSGLMDSDRTDEPDWIFSQLALDKSRKKGKKKAT